VTIYIETTRQFIKNPDNWLSLKSPGICVSARGWKEFSDFVIIGAPAMAVLFERFNGPVDLHPVHATRQFKGNPLSLAFTADECREMFLVLSKASFVESSTAYDVWEFLAMLAMGVNEEGLVSY
jgi:hypothetical protein